MTYRELYEELINRYADERGIICGKPCSVIYLVSCAGATMGFDNTVDDSLIEKVNRLLV